MEKERIGNEEARITDSGSLDNNNTSFDKEGK